MTAAGNSAILLFKDAEVLDFSGPVEVFSLAGEICRGDALEIAIVGDDDPVNTRN